MSPAVRRVGPITLLVLLIPSAAYLWLHDDVPNFCAFHDDCVYFVSAKSLATDSGYRIESLPGQPAQTKYPPVFPMLLSIAWRIDPEFPRNLPIAAWISWLAIPATLAAFSAILASLGITGGRALLVLAVFALNPYTIWFGSQLLSEPLFVAMTMVVFLMLERTVKPGNSANWALAVGIGAGLVYLTRTAGIALLPVALLYIWRKAGPKTRLDATLRFAAGMLPFVIGWTIWGHAHRLATTDPMFTYYTDYLAYEFTNVGLSNLHLVLWKNADGLLWGLGSLLVPKFTTSLALKVLAEAIAVAMISGVIRMLRQGYGQLYALFAVVYAAMLVLWHYPPDERFVFPLFPLGLVGLVYEGEHVLKMLQTGLRAPDAGNRIVARGMIAVLGLMAVGVAALEVYVSAVIQPDNAVQHRLRNAQFLAADQWLIQNTPRDAPILSNEDPALHLYTGNPVIRRSLLTRLLYAEDHSGIVDLWSHLGAVAKERGLKYVYWINTDYSLPVRLEDLEVLAAAHQADPALQQVYRNDCVTIYRVLD